MSRYRLLPTPAQQAVLRDHCGHARYVWNLAVEQHSHWHPGRGNAPGYLEQCRQLTQARAEHPWLAAGSQTVQQQALLDFGQAMAAFFDPGNPAGRPSWRKAGRDEGFRITGRRGRQWDVRRLSRKTGQVWVPKAGWVRFRWSRAVPPDAKSYRVTMDRAGRWHVAFAVIPGPVPAPGNGQAVGIDRGVAVSAALSTRELLHCPALTGREMLVASAEASAAADGALEQIAAGFGVFLDRVLEPEVQRILVTDGPAVLGLARFIELDERYALEPAVEAIEEANAAGLLRVEDPPTLARLLFGTMTRRACSSRAHPTRRRPGKRWASRSARC